MGEKSGAADAEGKRRDRIPGQFGQSSTKKKASADVPALDKAGAAKPAKPSFSAGVWRRQLSQAD